MDGRAGQAIVHGVGYCATSFHFGLLYGFGKEEEMKTHSSILAWETPWTEEPDGLQSLGSQRVRHDLVT